jgi:hypothetical protein
MNMNKISNELISTFSKVSEQGIKYNDENSPSDRYYGFLTQIEEITYQGSTLKWSLQFEIVPFEWMETAVLGMKGSIKSQPPLSPASLLVFDEEDPLIIANTFSINVKQMNEGDWYIITLGRGGLSASRMSLKAPLKPNRTKGMLGIIDKGRLKKLQDRFRPRGKVNVAAIRNMLAQLLCHEVAVMDVGAAGCNLIYDNNGVPQLYVDIGLPMFFNWTSLPLINPATGFIDVVNPGPCLANNPPVILTHWHWDHYTMAAFSNNAAALTNRPWIVPNQLIGPFANNIFLTVAPANRYIMPALLGGVIGGNVQVIQCAAVGPANGFNNTGLAVVVTVDAINNLRVLLPGDAAFQCIPGIGGIAGIRWMNAAHHGSDTDLIAGMVPLPNVPNDGRIAYSYGITPGGWHCYGHPRPLAINTYHATGWGGAMPPGAGRESATAETGPNSGVARRGNIMMSNNVIPPPCGVPNCPFHVFPKQLV